MAGRSAKVRTSTVALTAAALLSGLALAACTPDYSPDTYNAGAVQQANRADQGIVVGVRQIDIKVAGATGAVVGGAAGGIAGSQIGNGTTSAFGALGGSLVGGLLGVGVERAGGDTTAYEYVVRKTNSELVSVTQKDTPPLAIGQRVLVIAGTQARIVPDYTVALQPDKPPVATTPAAPPATPAATSPDSPKPPAVTAEPLAVPTAATPAAASTTDLVRTVPTSLVPAAPAADATPAIPLPATTPALPGAVSGMPTNLVPTLVAPDKPAAN